MVLKLNARVARCLHGKSIDYLDAKNPYTADGNPLRSFKNHFNMARSFTFDGTGRVLWDQLRTIAGNEEMPENPFNFWI